MHLTEERHQKKQIGRTIPLIFLIIQNVKQDTQDTLLYSPVRCSRCGQNYTPDVSPQKYLWSNNKKKFYGRTLKEHQLTYRRLFTTLKQTENKKSTMSETLWTSVIRKAKIKSSFFCFNEQKCNGQTQRSLCQISTPFTHFTAHLSLSVCPVTSSICLQQSFNEPKCAALTCSSAIPLLGNQDPCNLCKCSSHGHCISLAKLISLNDTYKLYPIYCCFFF